jgi:hypothetical protein
MGASPGLDAFGDDLAAAWLLTTDSFGFGEGTGHLGAGADLVRYVAGGPEQPPGQGPQQVEVRVGPAPGQAGAPTLGVLDSDGQPIAATPEGPGNALRLDVVPGSTYYFRVTGPAAADYQLQVTDFGNTDATASPIVVPAAGGVMRIEAHIDTAGNPDVFRVRAPASGLLSGRLTLAPGGLVSPDLQVSDDSGTLATQADATDALVEPIAVTAGQDYYIRAASDRAVTAPGDRYELNLVLAPTDAGHTAATASPLEVAATGTTTQLGVIATPGVRAVYRFVAPATTSLTIREAPHPIPRCPCPTRRRGSSTRYCPSPKTRARPWPRTTITAGRRTAARSTSP